MAVLALPATRPRWRVVQFTDLHLYRNRDGGLLGLNTHQSFESVLSHFKIQLSFVDVLLLTGDLSQDGSVESYQLLRERILPLDLPTYWIPGNHDIPAVMPPALNGGVISPLKQVLLPPWQIILLDSSQPHQVSGYLPPTELAFLAQCLADHPSLHTLVCLHHHPLSIDCDWMEPLGLTNGPEFLEVLRQYPQVRGILWGHIHQDYTRRYDTWQLMATPSTCVQFKPQSRNFTVDTALPGYRWLDLLEDGQIQTAVERVTSLGLGQRINMTSQGY